MVEVGERRIAQPAHLRAATLVLLPGADELWFVGDTKALLVEVENWVDQKGLGRQSADDM